MMKEVIHGQAREENGSGGSESGSWVDRLMENKSTAVRFELTRVTPIDF